ncbi:replication initiator protein A [Enterococcus hulanensis]|uniref:replication initiator protein A n=1 Tax=Enterococcus hulanensis TaxID=2559929 RepID=UPI0010F7C96B|nr:replication initiator protein A [Enterococcus hulanensis]
MTDFKFISANETYKALFYQLPKVLFESKKYIKMSNDSKIAYAMLKDRCEYSLQNNWVDKNGNIYFIFTTEELMELLHVGNKKVAAIKKELASFGLLLSKRMPPKTMPDGTKKGVPARLYLGQLDLTATDVFTDKRASSSESSESVEKTSSGKPHEINENSQSVEKTSSEKPLSQQHSPESVERTHNLYQTIDQNLKKQEETKRYSRNLSKQDDLLLKDFANDMIALSKSFLPYQALLCIQIYSNSFDEAYELMKAVHNAKANAEKQLHETLRYEMLNIDNNYAVLDADVRITRTIKNVFMTQKTETVKNLKGLMFVWSTNCFLELINEKCRIDELINSN